MSKLAIHVDNFKVSDTIIEAFTLVDGKDIDFNINRADFEEFCDKHSMRDWSRLQHNAFCGVDDDFEGTDTWEEIYAGWEKMVAFLKDYIQHLYDDEKMDIETPLKNILNPGPTKRHAAVHPIFQDIFKAFHL